MVHFSKRMLKQKLKQKAILKFAQLPGLVVGFVLIMSMTAGSLVHANIIDDQINQLNKDTSAKRSQQEQMGTEAASLSDKIAKLQNEISALQTQITGFQNKIDDLQKQVIAQEQELARQKKILGENIKAMYLEGDISTLEMLASSKDLSEFVDKQQYRNTVQAKVKTTVDKIVELKHQLKAQKEENEGLLKDKQVAQGQLNSQQSENNQLLSLNEGQQSALDAQIKQNNSNVSALRAQQLAANRKMGGTATPGDPGHGGYPAYLDNADQDSLIDPWGMYNRECVSYTAWKVYQTTGHMPYWGGHGNANQWPYSAQVDSIATGSTPRANSVAIWNVGYYGHAMWVEDVYSNGYIKVSQYNYDFQGHYSEMVINGAGLIYLYF